MIARLMRKDLLLNASQLLWTLAVLSSSAVYYGLGRTSAIAGMGFGAFLCSFLPVMMAGREDRFRAPGFLCTLPVTRREIVLARYFLTLAVFPLGCCLFALVSWPFAFPRFPAELFRPETLLAAFTAFSLSAAMVYPLVLRFGMLGLIYFLVGVQVLGTLGLTLGSRFVIGGGILAVERMIGEIGLAFGRLRDSIGAVLSFALALLALAGLWAASYAAALALFRRKEL